VARAKPSNRISADARFEVLEIRRLRGHEQIRPTLLEELTEQIKGDGYIKRPILVADRHFVILDGHHRVEALRALGCNRIPAYVVDYFSRIVNLGTWPDAIVATVTKDEVIERGLKDDRFPPKTTRHTVTLELDDRPTDLEDLM